MFKILNDLYLVG